jgi:hypothetical protein
MDTAKSIMIACIDLLMHHPLLALIPSLEAMTLHAFCPHGCNVRLDVILIYPLLIALSIAGLVVGLRRRGSTQPGIP